MTLRDVDRWTHFRGWQDGNRAVWSLAVGVCLVVLGCNSFGRKVEEVRSAMLGMKERELLSCLGPPTDFVIDAERRIFIYRMDLRRRAFVDIEDTPRTSKSTVVIPNEPAVCNAAFQIDHGVISDVEVRGVNPLGLNADSMCTIVVGECLADLAYTTGRWPAEALTP